MEPAETEGGAIERLMLAPAEGKGVAAEELRSQQANGAACRVHRYWPLTLCGVNRPACGKGPGPHSGSAVQH